MKSHKETIKRQTFKEQVRDKISELQNLTFDKNDKEGKLLADGKSIAMM